MILLTSLVFDMFIEFVAASDLGAIVMWLSDIINLDNAIYIEKNQAHKNYCKRITATNL